jgi:hypothetical protein
MSAIAATSASSAVASLLKNTAAVAQVGRDTTTLSPSKNPVDRVDLSDHAKAVLARARSEQTAADKLVALVQTLRDPSIKTAPTKSNAGSQLFDQLSGGAQPADSKSEAGLQLFGQLSKGAQAADSKSDAQALETLAKAQAGQGYTIADGGIKAINDISEALLHANTHTDHVDNFHVVVNDLLVPDHSTPEQIDQFYKSEDIFAQELAQSAPDYYAQDPDGKWKAIRDRSVIFLNAKDIPDLNFHNTLVFDFSGIGVSGGNGSVSYNHNASIFQDPTTYYNVGGNGDIIAWKKPVPT